MEKHVVEQEFVAALTVRGESAFDVDMDGVFGEFDAQTLRQVIAQELQERSAPTNAPTLARQPRNLNERWQLCGVLGRGGQATTYLGRDRASGEFVAIKELNLGRAADWKSVQLFEREAQALERIQHPGVPRFIAHFSIEKAEELNFYIVQEFVSGEDLEAALKRGTFDEASVTRIRDDMFHILEYLHRFNPPIIHRDLKPSNLVRRPDGRVVLIDFGAVQSNAAKTVGGSTVVGTSGYMPMEQFMGRATPASDLYSFGVTLIHLLSGVGPTDMSVEENRLKFEDRVRVSAPFERGLSAMIEPVAERRPQSVAEARLAFQTAVSKSTPSSLSKKPVENKSGRVGFMTVGLVAFIVSGAAAYYFAAEKSVGRVEVENIYASEPQDAKRVLFLGNSHTYWFEMPKIVAQMVPEGQPKLWYEVSAAPGVDVAWHVQDGLSSRINKGWDAVIVQPMSVEPAFNVERFGWGMAELEKVVPKHTRSIVWVPWARDPDYDIYGVYAEPKSGGTFEEMTRRLEVGVGGWINSSEICPIGRAWFNVRTELPNAPLFHPKDGSKATHVGAYLTGLMLYSCIYRRDPTEVTFVMENIKPESAKQIRAIASKTAREAKVF